MSASDVVTLVGVLVALAAIATPLTVGALTTRRRFAASIRYRLEGFAMAAELAMGQLVEEDLTTPREIDEATRRALVISLKEQAADFLAAITADAVRLQKRLDTPERWRAWHAMTVNLDFVVGRREQLADDELATMARQALGTAYISLIVLDLCRDREEALNWLRWALARESTESPVLFAAKALAPEAVPPGNSPERGAQPSG